MKIDVLVAGATGAIGRPLVRALVADGRRVAGLTRSPRKAPALRDLGARAVVADALDGGAMHRVLSELRPTHVIHQLTALPPGGPRSVRDTEPTNRLRIEGTRHLLEASLAAGVRRFIAGSFTFGHAAGPGAPRVLAPVIDAIQSMERQVLAAAAAGAIEGVVLRYGMFYGPDLPATRALMSLARRRLLPAFANDRSRLPVVHLEDAVAATVQALQRGRAGAVYDIVDDHPASMSDMARTVANAIGAPMPFTLPGWIPRVMSSYLAAVLSLDLPASNAAARADLAWNPEFGSMRDGLRAPARAAA